MIPKIRAFIKDENKVVDVKELSFKYDEVVYETGRYTEVRRFRDVEFMQSTGLKDKNGTEIYEGDIVQHSEKPNPCFSYPFKVIQARTGEWRLDNFRCGTVLAFSNQDELEVLGNIYENPELLEDE